MVLYGNGNDSDDCSDEDEDDENPVDGNIDFTESTILDPEVDDTEVEDQSLIVVENDFHPFKDKVHQLLHEFYYQSGGDITQSLMSDIIKLVKNVTNAKQQYSNAKVPAADLIFNYDDPRRTKN